MKTHLVLASLIFFTSIFVFDSSAYSETQSIPLRAKSGVVCGFSKNYAAEEESERAILPFEMGRSAPNFNTPTVKVSEKEWPALFDDLSFEGLDLAIDRQLKRYEESDLSGYIRLGRDRYSLKQARKSLQRFKDILSKYKQCRDKASSNCQPNFDKDMRSSFNAYRPLLTKDDPRFGEEAPVLFTAYYTPTLYVSKLQSTLYPYGVYRRPVESPWLESTRVEIDFRNRLTGQGLEHYYTHDLFSLYLMHVQGGGRVRFSEKGSESSRYLSYDGTNGQSWNFISKYMQEKNMIADGSIQSQREFLYRNPQLQEEIYATCPSYVYFKQSAEPPEGSDRVPLTDNRSIATDVRYYKFKGLLAFVSAERPIEDQSQDKECGSVEFKTFSRFYLDQDTGGAIRGKGRVDLYFGEGDYAELAAYNLVKRGDLYFFMLKR